MTSQSVWKKIALSKVGTIPIASIMKRLSVIHRNMPTYMGYFDLSFETPSSVLPLKDQPKTIFMFSWLSRNLQKIVVENLLGGAELMNVLRHLLI